MSETNDVDVLVMREQIMQRWDAWRKYIAEGGGGSWPRDEFESLLDDYERLLVLAVKHCPREHHDWQEILQLTSDA